MKRLLEMAKDFCIAGICSITYVSILIWLDHVLNGGYSW